MLGIVLGIFVILLGLKAFTEKGIPLTRQKNLTGAGAKVIGVICVLLGLLFIADGALAAFSVVRILRGRR